MQFCDLLSTVQEDVQSSSQQKLVERRRIRLRPQIETVFPHPRKSLLITKGKDSRRDQQQLEVSGGHLMCISSELSKSKPTF